MDKSKFDQAYDAIEAFKKREIEAATLRAVGEGLDSINLSEYDMEGITILFGYLVADLRAGKMPEGWKE